MIVDIMFKDDNGKELCCATEGEYYDKNDFIKFTDSDIDLDDTKIIVTILAYIHKVLDTNIIDQLFS